MTPELLELIRWLALPYGGNEPIFAVEDQFGRALPEGLRRQATWRAIFGEPDHDPLPGAWRQCQECRGWYVHHPGTDRGLNDQDVAELAAVLAGRTPAEIMVPRWERRKG